MEENSSPSMGAQTMGFLTEHIKGEIMLLQASARREPWLASSIIRVIGEMVIQSIAMEVATVIGGARPEDRRE